MSGSECVHDEVVVLVHGLWLHGLVMQPLARRLAARGYDVRIFSYPTVRLTLIELGVRLARFCQNLPGTRLNFVAHSMGGLVALQASNEIPRERQGRFVIAGTPFQGSYSGQHVQHLPGGRMILGRCMSTCVSGPRPLAIDHGEIGVIAGTGRFGLGRIVAPGLPQPNDGVVSVAETRIPGMRDHVTLKVSHTAMLISPEVVRQTCAFLRYGRFDHASGAIAQ